MTDDLRAVIARRVGQNLRLARERAGMTQKDVMVFGVMRQGNLSSVENGRKLPQLDTLLTLALLYGATLAELLDGLEGAVKSLTGV